MKPPQKMPLKAFIEETIKILHNSSSDELRAILTRMADEIKPHARTDFIKKLSPIQTFQHQKIPMDLGILDEIDSLKEDILELGEEEPDWECDDEDSLGQYEQFLPSLSDLFDKAAGLFEQGHYEVAQKAYQELFSIFYIEDDYGRGIHIYDVEDTDLEEARARYLRSLYMRTKEGRASTLLKTMTEMAGDDFHTRPNLQEIIDISTSPLPNFTQFLQEWIELTRKEEKPSYDAWLREGTFLLHGSAGLENLAKQEGYKRPRVYLDWMNSLIETKKFTEALTAGKTAFSCLPENQPIRAAIGDLLALCGEHPKNEQIQQDGRWISFKSKPDLPKLIALYEQNQSTNRPSLMQQASEAIETHRKKTSKKTYEKSWQRDDIESASHASSTLLLHALLFSGNKDQAFALAKRGESLGWSFGDNPQPLFIAYCLINATKCSLEHLPPHLKQF